MKITRKQFFATVASVFGGWHLFGLKVTPCEDVLLERMKAFYTTKLPMKTLGEDGVKLEDFDYVDK